MSINEIQKLTNKNIQEKANLIWEIATNLYGLYKPHEYGKVILPMTVIKRFDDALKDTKKEVVEQKRIADERNLNEKAKDAVLKKVAKHDFYNASKFDFGTLLSDPDNIKENFEAYLQGFSDNVIDIINHFKFQDQIKTLSDANLLYQIISEFNSKKADMSPTKITSNDMGYIFEELIRKFSESYDEEAGAHFTARDIIYLMAELLIVNEKEDIKVNGCYKTAYDMAMGTSQMLGCLEERLKEVNENAELKLFGEELNEETFAIAKADMLIKGGNADNMKYGDTLISGDSENPLKDEFKGYEFDYIISNPPFGIDWKKERKFVEDEYNKQGYDGRFGPGLPSISDGQMLFLLNGVKKLKQTGRMAIIQNGSSLFVGDAGSGPSEIRRYLIENDLLEAIIQLPNDLFYNTGIATYIWIITKNKSASRQGKVQLLDASKCYSKRRKNIGNKRVDLSDECINLIVKAYTNFVNEEINENGLIVESKVFGNSYFGYTKVTVETPLKNEKGELVLKKGKVQPDKSKRDTEIVPLDEDIDGFIEKNVLPYNKDAYLDRSLDKVGYEIPFTRIFYKFVPPTPSNEILKEIKDLEAEETQLMKELFGND